MKLVEYTSKRLVLETPEEKAIKKSWGSKWNKMKKSQDKIGNFKLIVGEWSGYTSNQRKIVHVDLCPDDVYKNSNGVFLGTIEYSDNTTLTVTIESYDFEKLLKHKIKLMDSYSSLISKMIKSGSQYYKV